MRYYARFRPIVVGSVPNGFSRYVNFGKREYVEEVETEVWGWVEYDKPLKNPQEWELIPYDNKGK